MFETISLHAGALFFSGAAMLALCYATWHALPCYTRKRVGSITFYSFGSWRVSVCRASKRERRGNVE